MRDEGREDISSTKSRLNLRTCKDSREPFYDGFSSMAHANGPKSLLADVATCKHPR